jgi:hypothetical protein
VGAWQEFVELGRNVMAIRVATERANECLGQMAAKVERITELNEKLWSHHFELCGQVTAELANAEREVLDELDALRQSVVDIRGNGHESRSERAPL